MTRINGLFLYILKLFILEFFDPSRSVLVSILHGHVVLHTTGTVQNYRIQSAEYKANYRRRRNRNRSSSSLSESRTSRGRF